MQKTATVAIAAALGLMALAYAPANGAAAETAPVAQACKAAIALVFERDPRIMVVEKVEGGIAYLHYTRPDDSSTWYYRCKLDDDRVIWSANDGGPTDHWREDQMITWRLAGERLEVRETFGDGTVAEKSFPLSAL